jgi:hypothetical protein
MVLELVIFNGVDLVELDTFGTCGTHESLRACAGVRC